MATVLIGLGSNLGDRHATLSRALDMISAQASITVAKVSRFREYPAAGGDVSQLPFLNTAAVLHSRLTPIEILRVLQETEVLLGRQRTERWGARTVDLDILLYDDLIVRSANLTIPHPRLAGRFFALEPSVEIAPDHFHPVCGMTLAAILSHLRAVPPWIALAPLGFWAFAGDSPPSENGAFRCDAPQGVLEACEKATIQIAAECVAMLRARFREKKWPAAAEHLGTTEDAAACSSANNVRMCELASRLHDMSGRGSPSVLLTGTWQFLRSRLSSPGGSTQSSAEGTLPRLVVLGPTALQYLPRISSAWRFPKESPASHGENPVGGVARDAESERTIACVRDEIDSCRGKVPMVFVESQKPQSVVAEIAGIVEGSLQSALG
ncbi:2-amino-4-hydroxy-6-hydroxymethyldihydropteridine diphosphokinase [Thermopirellula anaerolimosa]